jgi:hypothetical protein
MNVYLVVITQFLTYCLQYQGLAVRRACYSVLRYIMENGAKGAQVTALDISQSLFFGIHQQQVIVKGKVRAQRAKAMKFGDGYMVSSGHPAKIYLEKAFTHVQMRQGSIGIKVTAWHSHCVLVVAVDCSRGTGLHHVAARPHWSEWRQDSSARFCQDQRASRFQESVSVLCSSCFAVKLAGFELMMGLLFFVVVGCFGYCGSPVNCNLYTPWVAHHVNPSA